MTAPAAPAAAAARVARRPRDPRLDFFRGLAMFIILVAHIPTNPWTLWIPARFGWSDATEIFVFCSGMASALAFGGSFGSHGFAVGTARIGLRVWQVYWAHVGLVLVVIALMWSLDAFALGLPGVSHVARLPLVPFFEDTGAAIFGLMTLTWVPNYLDILPMYLVILAMIPVVMAAHRAGGLPVVAGLCGAVWLAAQFHLLDLPSRPWAPEIPWFFNPFGWQLVFFTGFALGMGWVRAPQFDRRLMQVCIGVLVVSLPFAWFRIHGGQVFPADWALTQGILDTRVAMRPLWAKTEFGLYRWLHFLALAWLAWVAVGEGGRRLIEGVAPPPPPSRRWLWVAAVVVAVTTPYTWVAEIAALSPALDAALLALLGEGARSVLGVSLLAPGGRIAVLSMLHLAGLVVLAWAALGPARREWASRRAGPAVVPVIRKVGSQSLQVFLVSMVLAQVLGVALDLMGRGFWNNAVVNVFGFGVLVCVAHVTGWYRAEPWRRAPEPAAGRRTPASRPAAAE